MSRATVTIRNVETNISRDVATNDRGIYVATLLPVGRYELRARALGYGAETREGIVLRLGQTVGPDFPFVRAEPESRKMPRTIVDPVHGRSHDAVARVLHGVENHVFIGARVLAVRHAGRNVYDVWCLDCEKRIAQSIEYISMQQYV
jgi:hypothetical protein